MCMVRAYQGRELSRDVIEEGLDLLKAGTCPACQSDHGKAWRYSTKQRSGTHNYGCHVTTDDDEIT